MIIKSLTPLQVTAGLTEAVAMAIFIKQPVWLRVATVGSYAGLILAKKANNTQAMYVAHGVDFAVSSMRLAYAKKTKQLKKEFGLGLGLNIISVTVIAIEEQYRSEMAKRGETLPRKSLRDIFKESYLEARARRKQVLPA